VSCEDAALSRRRPTIEKSTSSSPPLEALPTRAEIPPVPALSVKHKTVQCRTTTMVLLRESARRPCLGRLPNALRAGISPSAPSPSQLHMHQRLHLSSAASATRDLARFLKVSEEVQDAIATKRPVVALETTIYTHGALGRDLPEVLESVVREHGAVPATIGVLDGVARVGMSPAEVNRMVQEGATKLSRRDLAYVVGTAMTGRWDSHLRHRRAWGRPPRR